MPESRVPGGEALAVCSSDELAEGGLGKRFPVARIGARTGERLTGFVVRFAGKAVGYVNECAHVPSELDWQEGQFFDHSGLYLICATHGAAYEPESGRCVSGPCRGARLRALSISEHDGVVYWTPDDRIVAPRPEIRE